VKLNSPRRKIPVGGLCRLGPSFRSQIYQKVRCSAIWIKRGLPNVCSSEPRCPFGGKAYPRVEHE
jgi:hypothetical protein